MIRQYYDNCKINIVDCRMSNFIVVCIYHDLIILLNILYLYKCIYMQLILLNLYKWKFNKKIAYILHIFICHDKY